MNTYVAAGVGAVIAAGLVYMAMKPEPAPAPTPTAQVIQPTTPEAEPVPPVAEPAPETPVARPVTPEPAPRRAKERVKEPVRSAPVQTPVQTAPPTSTAPPSQTASAGQATPQQPAATQPPDPTWNPPPPTPENIRQPEKKVRVPQTVTIPAGTLVSIRIDQRISTQTNKTGDSFRASLDQPITVDDVVIAERGAKVEGRIVEADPGGRVQGVAKLSLELVRLDTSDGQRLRLQTQPFAKEAESQKKRDAMKIGAAAGIGAAIGAIAGGGKGAAIGAATGGAAGAGGVAATRGTAAEIPAETHMTFRLSEAITVTEKVSDN